MSFRADLTEAGKQGVLIAVKWIIGLALAGCVSYGVVNDYLATRTRAVRGDAAAAYIEKILAEQQKAQAKPPEAPK